MGHGVIIKPEMPSVKPRQGLLSAKQVSCEFDSVDAGEKRTRIGTDFGHIFLIDPCSY
jgi:hypothetical protein